MTRPEKFLTASAEDVSEAVFRGPYPILPENIAWLRDEVAREVREECEAEREAERAQWQRDAIHNQTVFREMKARAERAERERDEWDKSACEMALEVKRLEAEVARLQKLSDGWMQSAEEERAKNADAERKGAWDALTKLAAEAWTHVTPFPNAESFDVMLLRRRDTHYAPVAPAGVTLGEWVVTCEGNLLRAVKPDDVREQDVRGANQIPLLLMSLDYTPTADEYAALLALAAPQEGRTDA